jgi:hypothetical protein
VSPLATEYRPKRVCSTQNKAKRANKIVFLLLVRDQEVEGSNPFAPTISSIIYLGVLIFIPENINGKIENQKQSQKPHPLRSPQRMGNPGLHTTQPANYSALLPAN